MWLVNPKILCKSHLLGEHNELHKIVGSIKKKKSLKGYIEKGFIETKMITERHKQLAKEMKRRGYNHNSPIDNIYIDKGEVDINKSLKDLLSRCKECKKRYRNETKTNNRTDKKVYQQFRQG